ncbi:MAG: hypothetical protein R6V60_17870 [Desulfobacterales bacterium]
MFVVLPAAVWVDAIDAWDFAGFAPALAASVTGAFGDFAALDRPERGFRVAMAADFGFAFRLFFRDVSDGDFSPEAGFSEMSRTINPP